MNEPQYNPKETALHNFKRAFEQGKLAERERCLRKEIEFLEELQIFKLPIYCDICKIVCVKIGKKYIKLEELLSKIVGEKE